MRLNNGVAMPQLGLGVFQVPEHQAEAVVRTALLAGYRLLDTAASYGNEAGVGRAVRTAGIPRDAIFVTTKLQNSEQGYDRALRAFDRSLIALGLDTVDLYLIHWPVPARGRYVETWRALEQIYASGRARAVGVCNFRAAELDRLSQTSDLVPAVNQVELHPGYPQESLRVTHSQRGIMTEAWSPLGRGQALLDRPEVTEVARACRRSPAQVVLRWHLDLGHVAIPKSSDPVRLASNFDVFGFTLTDAQRSTLSRLPAPGRVGPDPDTFDAH